MEEGGDGKIGSLKMTGIGGAVRKSERNSLASSFDRFAARDGRTARWQGWAGIMGMKEKEDTKDWETVASQTFALKFPSRFGTRLPRHSRRSFAVITDYGSASRLASSAIKWHVALRNDTQT